VGMGFGRVLCKWEGEKVSGKKIFKNPLLPCLCICRGEEAAPCRSKKHRAVCLFFFLKKRKMNLGVTQKWVMTIIMS
jgi:hypothetical protein